MTNCISLHVSMLSMINIFIDKWSVARSYGSKSIFPPICILDLYLEGWRCRVKPLLVRFRDKLVICTVVFKHCIVTLPNRKTTAATVGDINTISRSLQSIVCVLVLEVWFQIHQFSDIVHNMTNCVSLDVAMLSRTHSFISGQSLEHSGVRVSAMWARPIHRLDLNDVGWECGG